MVDKKNLEYIVYIFGIVSVVLAFVQPLAGFILGILGYNEAKKIDGSLAKKAKKYNKIGAILSGIFIILSLIALFFISQGLIEIPPLPGV